MARARTASAAACTALPATTVDRDAHDPAPNGCRSVSPLTTLHRLRADAERVRRDLGQHGLDALPQRRAAGVHVHRAGPADHDVGGLLRAEAALLQERGHAEPAPPAAIAARGSTSAG